MSRYAAERFELEVEYNSQYDYHSELWASEIESMKGEMDIARAELEEELELGSLDGLI